MHKLNFFTLLISALLIFFSCAKKEDFVIKVNDSTISLHEFEDRLNFEPFPNQYWPDSLKKEYLTASLIAERIFALQAQKIHLDTLSKVTKMIKEYKNEAVFEKWMNEEIIDKIHISNDELKKAYLRFKEQRVVTYRTFPDSSSAFLYWQQLKQHSAAVKKADAFVKSKTISFGEAWKPVEDIVYHLKPGEISEPINVDGTYYVFMLRKIIPHPIFSKYDFDYWKPSLLKRVRNRHKTAMFDSALSKLMADKQFTIKREVYDFVLQQLIRKIPFRKKNGIQSPAWINWELVEKPSSIKNSFNKPFLRFKNGDIWTIGDFWEKLTYGPYLLNYKSPDELKQDLPFLIRKMVIMETIVKKGYEQGLQNSEYVKEQTEMWKESILSKVFQHSILDTMNITDRDMLKFYEANKKNYQKPETRRIQEILVTNRELARKLITRINAGEDMGRLAEKYSIRKIKKKYLRDGFYITKNEWGKIGQIAFSLSPGNVYGPIKIEENKFSIIKLIEIKKNDVEPFINVKNKVYTDLADERFRKTLNKILEQHIMQDDITINKPLINKTQILKGSMVVFKTHFPVRTVVPGNFFFSTDEKWYKYFEQKIWRSK